MKRLIVGLLLFLLIFTRFYNLPRTNRFTRDESQNLVDIHRIYVDRDITLIGPIDGTKTIIYPSLTFYMLLPFAFLGSFEPWSPSYGTAFFGLLTVFLILFITKQLNKKYVQWLFVFLLFGFPFLESARWAWNPHLVPFTSSLAFIFFFTKGKWWKLLSGIFFGLSFHLHYLTIISFAVFLGLWAVSNLKKRNLIEPFLVGLGFFLTIIPFIIFDLKNPPGLFFGYFLQNNMARTGAAQELSNLPMTLLQNLWHVLIYLAKSRYLAGSLAILLSSLVYLDIKKRRFGHFVYFLPVVAQTVAISFLPVFANRYFLLGIIFFIVWLILKRDDLSEKIVKVAFVVMAIGGLLSLDSVLTKPIMEPSAFVVGRGADAIKQKIKEDGLKNVNIAVLASPDRDPLGTVYRHTLLVKDSPILSEFEYATTDDLFVVTTSDESVIRDETGSIMHGFRKGKVEEIGIIDEKWKLYLFKRE